MSCDHTAGLDVRSELVYEIDELSGMNAHKYILSIQAVICKGCGGTFEIGGHPTLALRLDHPHTPVIVPPDDAPTVTVDDFEM